MKSKVLIEFIGDTKSADNATKNVSKSISNGLSKASKAMAPYSAAATGVITAIAKTGIEFDKSMKNVQAISGATTEDMKKLEEAARKMGKETVYSASESADALSYMALAGWDAEQMAKGLPGVLNLAAAGNVDLAQTCDIVTDGLTAFGMSAEESTKLADIMAATMSKSNTSVEMLGESFKYVAPIAGSLGYTAEDTSIALGLMANAGIKASSAGTSLRAIMTRLSTNTGGARDAIEKMGVKVMDSSGKMRPFMDVMNDVAVKMDKMSDSQKTATANTIAGKNAMGGFLAMMNATDADLEKLSTAVYNSAGASQKMADVMNESVGNQLKILGSEVSELALQFAEIMLPTIKKVVIGLQKFVQKIQTMSPAMKKVVSVILVAVAAAVPILMIIGKVISAITMIGGAISKVLGIGKLLFAGVKLLFGVIMANPIVAIIVGIIAVLVLLWTKCEWFRNAVMTGINAIWNFIKVTFDFIKNLFIAHIQIFISIVQSLWSGIKAVIGLIVAGVKMHIQMIVAVVRGIVSVVTTVMNAVKNGFNIAFNFVVSVVRGYINTVLTIIRTIWNVSSSIINKVKNGFQILGNGIKSVFSNVANFIRNVFSRIGGYVKAPINAVIRGLNKIKLPSWVPGLGGKGINIPYLATGTNYVPADTLAMIHKGEAVIPKKFNPYANDIKPQTLGRMNAGSGTTIVNNIDVKVEQDPLGQMVNKIKTYSGGAKNDYNYGMGV